MYILIPCVLQAGSLPALIAAAVALGTGKGSELNDLKKTNSPFLTLLDDLVELRDNTYAATSTHIPCLISLYPVCWMC